MMNKHELRQEIRALRHQMANLETKCQEREDKMLEVFAAISPFFEIMSEAQQRELAEKLGVSFDH